MKTPNFLSTSIQSIRPAFVLIAGILAATPALAQSTWNAGTGTWSTDVNWLPVGVPLSSNTTQLIFNNTGTGYTTTNDIGTATFLLNRLTINNTGTGDITIASNAITNTITFAGTDPTLDVTGSAVLTGLFVGNASAVITKAGPGTFIHDSDNGGFQGTLIVNQGTFINRSTIVAVTNF